MNSMVFIVVTPGRVWYNHMNFFFFFPRYKNECDYQEGLRSTLEELNQVWTEYHEIIVV